MILRLCIATGRVPLSHRTHLDYTVIDRTSTATVRTGRDMRLALAAQICEVTEAGFNIHFTSTSNLDSFEKEVIGVRMKFENLMKSISPLPGKYFLWLYRQCYIVLSLMVSG